MKCSSSPDCILVGWKEQQSPRNSNCRHQVDIFLVSYHVQRQHDCARLISISNSADERHGPRPGFSTDFHPWPRVVTTFILFLSSCNPRLLHPCTTILFTYCSTENYTLVSGTAQQLVLLSHCEGQDEWWRGTMERMHVGSRHSVNIIIQRCSPYPRTLKFKRDSQNSAQLGSNRPARMESKEAKQMGISREQRIGVNGEKEGRTGPRT